MNKLYSGVTETEGRSRGVKAQWTDSDLGDKYANPERGLWSLLEMFYLSFHWSLNSSDGFHVSCLTFHAVAEGQPEKRLRLKKGLLINESKTPFNEMRLSSSGVGYLRGKRDIWNGAVSTAFLHKHKLLSLAWVAIWIWCVSLVTKTVFRAFFHYNIKARSYSFIFLWHLAG